MACPLTKGSLGSWTSRGTISVCEGFLEEIVSEANVFDRGRKGEEDGAGGEVAGDVGEGSENAGCDGERVAEVSEAFD